MLESAENILVRLNEMNQYLSISCRAFWQVSLLTYRKCYESAGSFSSSPVKFYQIAIGVLSSPELKPSIGLEVIATLGFYCLLDPGKPLNNFISVLRPSSRVSKSYVLLAASLNTLGQVLRSRPECFARGLPILLEWYDLTPRYDAFSVVQRRNLEQTVKLQLGTLLSSSEASQFLPLITEALSKRKQQLASIPAAGKSKGKEVREKTSAPPVTTDLDEPEEKYSKRLKPSAAFADETSVEVKSKLNVLKLPLQTVINACLKTCRRLEPSIINARLENWRPTFAVNVGATEVAYDPRKKKEATVKTFHCQPETYDLGKFYDYLRFNFGRLLNAGVREGLDIAMFGSVRRKEWASLVSRYAVSINDPLVDAQLMDYCFQDLTVRCGLLVIWLRYKWVDCKESEIMQYEQAIVKVLGRIESLLELDSSSSELEEAIGDILVYTPGTGLESSFCMFFMRGLGLADMMEQEEGEEIPQLDPDRLSIMFRLLKRLLNDRPGYRSSMVTLIEELLVNPNDAIRSEAIKCCGSTMNLSPLREAYLEVASNKINNPELTEHRFELFFELLHHDFSLFKLIRFEDETGVGMFKTALPLILQHVNQNHPEMLNGIGDVINEANPAFLTVLAEAWPSLCPVPTDLLNRILVLMKDGSIPSSLGPVLLEKELDKTKQLLQLFPLIVKYHLEGGTDLFSSLQLLITRQQMSPSDIFVRLHQEEVNLGLKGCIEACNVCFGHPNIWNAEVLIGSLETLLLDDPLPTTFMRSVIQTLALHQTIPVTRTAIQSILGRLISGKVWEKPRLWEGWLRTCKMLLPQSLPLITQLPIQQVKDVLDHVPEARIPLKEYLWQQPPSLRNRFSAILSLVD